MKKITCEDFERDFSSLTSGDLDASRREDLEQHLENCPDCSRYSEEYHSIRKALSNLPPIKVPAYFEANLKREINRYEKGLKRPQWDSKLLPRFVAIGTGLAMALFVSMMVFQPSQPPLMPGSNQPGFMAESEKAAPLETMPSNESIATQDELLLVESSASTDTAIHRLPEPAGMDSIPVPVEDDPWQINQVSTTPEEN